MIWMSALMLVGSGVANCADDIRLESVGRGMDEQEATKRALLSAVEQAVGVLSYSKVVIKNDEIEEDAINNLSNGFVSSYKKLSAAEGDGGIWVVKVSAVVRKGTVADFLKRKGIESKVDLKNDWARLSTGLKAKRDALELYKTKMPEIKAKLYTVQLVDMNTGKPVNGMSTPYIEEDLDGSATCVWVYKIAPDLKFWKECAHPLLEACFKSLAVGHKSIDVTYSPKYRGSKNYYKTAPSIIPRIKFVSHPRDGIRSGLHLNLFDPSYRKLLYQGDLRWKEYADLYGVMLENPLSSQSSKVTMFYFTHEVMSRIFELDNSTTPRIEASKLSLWSLICKVDSTEGNTYVVTSKDRNDTDYRINSSDITMMGDTMIASGTSGTYHAIYFGPWVQWDRQYQGIWPKWTNLSYYANSRRGIWPFVGLHQGKPYSFQGPGDGFAEWFYLPVVITLPLDELPKINRLTATLSVE